MFLDSDEPNPETSHLGFDFVAGYCREFAIALAHEFQCPLEATLEHEYTTGRVVGLVHAYGLADPVTLIDVAGVRDIDALLGTVESLSRLGVFSRRFMTPTLLARPFPGAPPLNPAAQVAAQDFIRAHPERFQQRGVQLALSER